MYIILVVLTASCSGSGGTHADRIRISNSMRDDSLALKIATSSTLDCLPLFLAKEHCFFDKMGVEVRLHCCNAQMDCDTAMSGGSVEGMVSDMVRTERLARQGVPMRYVAVTGGYWQLVGNRRSRVKRLEQLGDKIIAMTRYSATDWLSETFLAGVKTGGQVFRVQVNDVPVRMRMLLNSEVDAAWLPEPYATEARLHRHKVLADSRDSRASLGVVAFRQQALKDMRRQRQVALFVKAYNAACDSLNRYGVPHYFDILQKYYNVDRHTVMALPQMRFKHAAAPEKRDMEKVSSFVASTLSR